MKDLKSLLKEYLGSCKKPPGPDELIQLTKLSFLKTPDGVIRVIDEIVKLDISFTASFFDRDVPTRYIEIAHLIEKITKDKNAPFPHMSEGDLRNASQEVALLYRRLIGELYELAAMHQIMVVIFGSKKNVRGAIDEWEHYLYLAEGHSDQKNRIEIAKQQLRKMRSGNFD